MPRRDHLKLNTSAQKESSKVFSFNYGFPPDKQPEKEKDYKPMAESFQESLEVLENDRLERESERNKKLYVPDIIEYVRIEFFDQFNSKYFVIYLEEFGLQAIEFNKFNREVLFAIDDDDLFETFLENIERFILKTLNHADQKFNSSILYIKDFKLLTTENILGGDLVSDMLNFKIPVFPAGETRDIPIMKALINYLNERGKNWRISNDKSFIEIHDLTSEEILEIARNFDVVTNISNTLATVIQPSDFGIEERSYGFIIANPDEDLPLIGILDTGIDNNTPLGPIIIDDESLNITLSSPLEDNANEGYGHGTGVAALAALGKKPYLQNYQGEFNSDAKLLSIKILDNKSGDISGIEVLRLLQNAKDSFPELKLFVLTVCYQHNKEINSLPSSYAAALDRFSHENDCLVIISSANNPNSENQSGYSLEYLCTDETSICAPAESMNNITVGACADNIKEGKFEGISTGPKYPAIYTRTGYIKLERFKDPKKSRYSKNNKNLFKPDLIESGGDYEQGSGFIGQGEKASLEVLSADPTRSFMKWCGTSYSAPLVANMAAQVLKKYPNLRAQTIKALLINSASAENIVAPAEISSIFTRSIGYGIINPEKCLNSSDDRVTIVIEDFINPGKMEIIPINFPDYLSKTNLSRKTGLVLITATLCFDFLPDQSNHLSYCPYHLAFSIFRNHSHEQIQTKEETLKSKLRVSWSQNNRWKEKPIPPSNVQKISFQVGKKELLSEDSTFKLAVHADLSTQLLNPDPYDKPIPYSIVITIEENLKDNTGKLYDELKAINELESVVETEIVADVVLT